MHVKITYYSTVVSSLRKKKCFSLKINASELGKLFSKKTLKIYKNDIHLGKYYSRHQYMRGLR